MFSATADDIAVCSYFFIDILRRLSVTNVHRLLLQTKKWLAIDRYDIRAYMTGYEIENESGFGRDLKMPSYKTPVIDTSVDPLALSTKSYALVIGFPEEGIPD